MSKSIERVTNIAILLAAIALIVAVILREVRTTSISASGVPALTLPPVYVVDWKSLDTASVALDNSTGQVRVFVFSDLECPYCAYFHDKVVPSLYDRFGGDVTVRLVHFPLQSHRFSRQASAALECAAAQGKALEFLDVTYSLQDSIGLLGWSEYAIRSNVPDPQAFAVCLASEPHKRIASGEALGQAMGVSSTPTVIVNGWRFLGVPDSSSFLTAIDSIRVGASPFYEPSKKR